MGTILATTNGGGTWTPQSSGTTNDLTAVDFLDASRGWAVGDQGTILATTNGGGTSTPQSSGTTNGLLGVDFIGASSGWAVGDQGTILATTNGGGTWTPQSSGTTNSLHAVAFADATHGWAMGSGGTILGFQLAPGGTTWQPYSSGTTNSLYAVSLIDYQFGGAVGGSGTILGLSLTPGGLTWTAGASRHGGNPVLTRLGRELRVSRRWARRASSSARAAGRCGRSRTILFAAPGAPWTPQSSGTAHSLHGVAFVESLHGWAVGDQGTILATATGGKDVIAPTTTPSGAVDGRWYKAPVTVTLTATDGAGGSGVASTE